MDAGTGFYGADKFSGFVEGVHRAGIELGVAAAQGNYIQISFFKIDLIQIRDFQLTASRRADGFCIFEHMTVIEISPVTA